MDGEKPLSVYCVSLYGYGSKPKSDTLQFLAGSWMVPTAVRWPDGLFPFDIALTSANAAQEHPSAVREPPIEILPAAKNANPSMLVH